MLFRIEAYKEVAFYESGKPYKGYTSPNNKLWWLIVLDTELRSRLDGNFELADKCVVGISEYEQLNLSYFKNDVLVTAKEICDRLMCCQISLSFILMKTKAINSVLMYFTLLKLKDRLEALKASTNHWHDLGTSLILKLEILLNSFESELL